ncbi:hypothetical protein [Streptomyces wuyuanensis]|uniref:hypothetical protein n=1 Tax=Streptomyces wuyuanensis TaxID=1196353 RepID=UPI003723FD69
MEIDDVGVRAIFFASAREQARSSLAALMQSIMPNPLALRSSNTASIGLPLSYSGRSRTRASSMLMDTVLTFSPSTGRCGLWRGYVAALAKRMSKNRRALPDP